MKAFSTHLSWLCCLAGLLLLGIVGCEIESEPESEECGGASCGDGNECTADACDPSNDVCTHLAVADGTDCNDGTGMCMNGLCIVDGVDGCGSVPQTFADGDFADGVWASAEVPVRSYGTRSLDSVTTVSPGGNSGAYHRVEVTVTATEDQPSTIWVAHALAGAQYDPSMEGEICALSVFLDGTDQFDLPNRSSFFSVFLLQAGTYYWGERLEVKSGTWETGTWAIDDFVKFHGDGPDAPDLSASGTSIQFGYLTGSSRPVTAPGTGTTVAGVDNFKVDIFPPAL